MRRSRSSAARDDRFLELTVAKSRKGRVRYARVLLEKNEVKALLEGGGNALENDAPDTEEKQDLSSAGFSGSAAAQLTAYFCVSRARMILRALFSEPKREGKTNR